MTRQLFLVVVHLYLRRGFIGQGKEEAGNQRDVYLGLYLTTWHGISESHVNIDKCPIESLFGFKSTTRFFSPLFDSD